MIIFYHKSHCLNLHPSLHFKWIQLENIYLIFFSFIIFACLKLFLWDWEKVKKKKKKKKKKKEDLL